MALQLARDAIPFHHLRPRTRSATLEKQKTTTNDNCHEILARPSVIPLSLVVLKTMPPLPVYYYTQLLLLQSPAVEALLTRKQRKVAKVRSKLSVTCSCCARPTRALSLAAQNAKNTRVSWWRTWIPYTFYGTYIFLAFSAARDAKLLFCINRAVIFNKSIWCMENKSFFYFLIECLHALSLGNGACGR